MNNEIVIVRMNEGAKKHATRRNKEELFKKNKSENCSSYYNGYYVVEERGIRMFHGRSKNCRNNMHYYKKAVRSRLNNVYRIEEDFNLPKNFSYYKRIYSNGID